MNKFRVGQRVICVDPVNPNLDHHGYYGRVTAVHVPDPKRNSLLVPVYDVSLMGRAEGVCEPFMLDAGFDPYPFFESELEAAD